MISKTSNCPLCNQPSFNVITTHLRRGNGTVYFCNTCSHGFLEPEHKIDSKSYYSEGYRNEYSHKATGEATNAREIFNIYKKYQEYRLEHIKPFLNKNQTFLELGASSGQFIVNIRDSVKEVNAIELDRSCYSFMKDELEIDADFEYLKSSKFSDKKYDVICSFQVLEHVESPTLFLSDIKSSMNANSTAFVEVPNLNDALLSTWDIESYQNFYYHSAHLHYFTKKSLLKVAIDAGFKLEQVSFVFLQDYNLLNHLNWITNHVPQNTCDIGLSKISLTGKDLDISSWLSKELSKLNNNYVQKLVQTEATSNVMMILKN